MKRVYICYRYYVRMLVKRVYICYYLLLKGVTEEPVSKKCFGLLTDGVISVLLSIMAVNLKLLSHCKQTIIR